MSLPASMRCDVSLLPHKGTPMSRASGCVRRKFSRSSASARARVLQQFHSSLGSIFKFEGLVDSGGADGGAVAGDGDDKR